MSEPIQELRNIDPLLHEPSRLAILATLDACASADFQYLQSLTGLSKTNLSMQLLKLEEHGLIAIEKTFVRKTPRTDARLTKDGKAAMRNYWRVMENAKQVKLLTLRRMALKPEPALG